MGSLRINQVVYQGDNYEFQSPIFEDNIVLIEGDNGTGKTTFCNLIYYGLGGGVVEFKRDADKRHVEIADDTNNYVDLYISLSGKNYQLRRFLQDNDISVTEYIVQQSPQGPNYLYGANGVEFATRVFPVNRSLNASETFSDWLLEQLGISVVELYQGFDTFKINFVDLMRLIYHDQKTEPENIYKKIDTKVTYFSDSELRRKAAFELLIGKSFSDLYDAIVEYKKAEKEQALAKDLLDEYLLLANKIKGNAEIVNRTFLEKDLREAEDSINRLQHAREAFKRNRSTEGNVEPAIAQLKNQLLAGEVEVSKANERLLSLYDERSKLTSVRDSTAGEIEQLNKVIHSHDQLNLFSADTCPYCLNPVHRATGQCVCGTPIDEKQYERFFYTSQEYKDILKAKMKSFSTILTAIEGCSEEVASTRDDISNLNLQNLEIKTQLQKLVSRFDEDLDLDTLNDIDDKILETREKVALLQQKIDIEVKLENLNKNYEAKRKETKKADDRRRQLEISTRSEIGEKVKSFSTIYNDLVTQTLKNCRSARISEDDYFPVIDGGVYKERSSAVSIRLMYFLTLLKMSLSEDDVPFPRFLLVDTPETAGVELPTLIGCIEKLRDLEDYDEPYQVILTTGLAKYPADFVKYRVMYMPDKTNMLLTKRH
ncbi:AAA family ATPase [Herbaspirillum sp. 1130]|uniref:AAA family ATPase n=1 Tax=Herbaspirillum sp. 1130 TaxID=2806562 RepID=UPI001AE6E87B|nr:AAA family ATPase [Herbaspirillum sp. 1130]MBP1317121.1 DNA repair exonuclease SbcCD ATPase subunit [Herbaspirillum sp. 1130]